MPEPTSSGSVEDERFEVGLCLLEVSLTGLCLLEVSLTGRSLLTGHRHQRIDESSASVTTLINGSSGSVAGSAIGPSRISVLVSSSPRVAVAITAADR